MTSDSTKRNTHFPGSSIFLQTIEPPRDGSSPKLPTSKWAGRRLRHGLESSHRTSSKLKAEEHTLLQSRSSEAELIPVWKGTPWESYEEKYDLNLGGWITVAGKKPRTTGQVIAVRVIPNVEEYLYRIQQLRHENFVSVYEIFAFESSFYIISERMQISLDHVVASPAYPDESELASIIWQVLNGISYLLSQNMAHGDITCSNILVSREGDVKIANPECCHHVDQGDREQTKDLMAIGPIMVELMEKRSIESGNIGLEDTGPWSDDIVEFLPLTDSPSLEQLKTVIAQNDLRTAYC